VRRPPVLRLGDGVLDADPPGGLLFAGRFPLGDLAGGGGLPRFLGRGGDLAGEVAGQALVSGVDVGGDTGVAAEQVLDALGAQRGDVVHAARADRAEPQQPSPAIADGGGLGRVLFILSVYECSADLASGLGTVNLTVCSWYVKWQC